MIKKILNGLCMIISFPIILIIICYQRMISPITPSRCRFTPTCSNYALEAFKKYNPIKALYLSLKRISKCHPWGGFGHDPLP